MFFCVTGASGFIGKAVCSELVGRGHKVRAIFRDASSEHMMQPAVATEAVFLGNISGATDWQSALKGIDVVIHCAAKNYSVHKERGDSFAAYQSINIDGSRRLIEEAALAGVQRLVFLSTIKVNGEFTEQLHLTASGLKSKKRAPFSMKDVPLPKDLYALSKWQAEKILKEVSSKTGIETVIIRPPLVYGLGVKGNFARMIKWIRKGVPLPFGSIHNLRSLVALDNLVDLICTCSTEPVASGKTFLVSDNHDLSTPELLSKIATQMQRPLRLLPVPVSLLLIAGKLANKSDEIDRLVGSLQVDMAYTQQTLKWNPPISVEKGISSML